MGSVTKNDRASVLAGFSDQRRRDLLYGVDK